MLAATMTATVPSRHNPQLLSLPQLSTAKQKIGVAAASYDPKDGSLQPFLDCEYMTPTEFRYQLQQSLYIHLTDEELGALVLFLDRDGSRDVCCDEFMREFFSLGRIEKSKRANMNREEKRRREMRVQRWKHQKEELYSRMTSIQVDKDFTAADESSVMRKIAQAAADYDKSKGGMEGFLNASTLTGSEFKDLLRQSLGVHLTSKETGAALKLFNKKHRGADNILDCKDFLIAFQRLGRIQRQQDQQQRAQLSEKREKVQSEIFHHQLKLRRQTVLISSPTPYTEADYQSFKDKIKKAAYYFDKKDVERVKRIFGNEDSIKAGQLKRFVENFFGIELSLGELTVAMEVFDVNHDGLVSSADLLSTLYRIQWKVKCEVKRHEEMRAERKAREEAEKWRRKEAEAAAKLQTHVVWPDLEGLSQQQQPLQQHPLQQQLDLIGSSIHNSSYGSSGDSSVGSNSVLHSATGSPLRSAVSASAISSSSTAAATMATSSSSICGESCDGQSIAAFSVFTQQSSVAASVSRQSSASPSRSAHRARKQKAEDIFSAGRLAHKLVTTHQPLASMFPHASPEIKDFLQELEDKEKALSGGSSAASATKPRSEPPRLPSIRANPSSISSVAAATGDHSAVAIDAKKKKKLQGEQHASESSAGLENARKDINYSIEEDIDYDDNNDFEVKDQEQRRRGYEAADGLFAEDMGPIMDEFRKNGFDGDDEEEGYDAAGDSYEEYELMQDDEEENGDAPLDEEDEILDDDNGGEGFS